MPMIISRFTIQVNCLPNPPTLRAPSVQGSKYVLFPWQSIKKFPVWLMENVWFSFPLVFHKASNSA